jgi:hypothetical protein
MSLTATNSVTISGAQTVTCFSGGGTLVGLKVNVFSGVASISGDVVLALDAVSGISAASSGRVLYQYVAGAQSGWASALAVPAIDFEAACSSGLVVTGAANAYTLVSWSK